MSLLSSEWRLFCCCSWYGLAGCRLSRLQRRVGWPIARRCGTEGLRQSRTLWHWYWRCSTVTRARAAAQGGRLSQRLFCRLGGAPQFSGLPDGRRGCNRRWRQRRPTRRNRCARRLEGQQAQQHHRQRGVFVGGQAQVAAPVQAQAVEQLGFVRRHHLRQPGGFGDFRVGVVVACAHLGHGLQHGHALQHGGHFFQRRGGAQAVQAQRLGGFHHRAPVATRQRFDQAKHIAAVHAAQHGAHAGFVDTARAKGNRLIRQRQCIAHRAARRARQQAQRLRLGRHIFSPQHANQMLQHRFRRHRAQVKLQAARQHRGRHFLRVGRG